MKYYYAFIYIVMYPFFNLVHPSRVIGRENIPEGGVLICSNHTTANDPVFVMFAMTLKRRLRAMGKKELLKVPFIGLLLEKAGVIWVARGKADVGAIKTSMKALKDGERLLIFPEGTRVRKSDGEMSEAKNGAALLSTRCNVPILPVYLPEKKLWFRRTTIVIGEPYIPEIVGKKGTQEEYEAITCDLMERIEALAVRGK